MYYYMYVFGFSKALPRGVEPPWPRVGREWVGSWCGLQAADKWSEQPREGDHECVEWHAPSGKKFVMLSCQFGPSALGSY